MQYFHKLFDIHNYPWVKTIIHKCVKQSQDFTFETPFYLKIKTAEILDGIRHFGDSCIGLYNVYDDQEVDINGNTQGQYN